MTESRADRNNYPTAFTTDVAREAGLILGIDYEPGDPFPPPNENLVTAKLLRDPLWLTFRVIDSLSFITQVGNPRWLYINIPYFIWLGLSWNKKKKVVQFMYQHEGGTELEHLFK